MTRLEPGDVDYSRIYTFWIKNDKPAVCRLPDETWMLLETDNKLVFIKIGETESGNYMSTSTNSII